MKKPSQQECPACGFKTKKQPKVTTQEGTLIELQRGRQKRATPESKAKLYAKLRAGAKAAGFKDGWASWKYREFYGVWPRAKQEIDQSFYDWLITQPKLKITQIVFGLVK